jgi:hypothetical protein
MLRVGLVTHGNQLLRVAWPLLITAVAAVVPNDGINGSDGQRKKRKNATPGIERTNERVRGGKTEGRVRRGGEGRGRGGGGGGERERERRDGGKDGWRKYIRKQVGIDTRTESRRKGGRKGGREEERKGGGK